jgi:hypothetical protein
MPFVRGPFRAARAMIGHVSSFVPAAFVPPDGLDHPRFRLRPLGPEHNESDYAAWSSSIDHIRATPGWADSSWPRPMSIEENLDDLVRHRADFEARTGFTYTVLAPTDDVDTVIGCVYIYPADAAEADPPDAVVLSWVRAADAPLDAVLAATVREWLERDWPFRSVRYASREAG